MANYALLNQENIVTFVFVGKNENENNIDWESYYNAKRTSYNTNNGVHLNGGVPFRKNYAGIGYFYDTNKDAFIPPKPFLSWILNEVTCNWEPPIPRPSGDWYWDEETISWKEISNDPI